MLCAVQIIHVAVVVVLFVYCFVPWNIVTCIPIYCIIFSGLSFKYFQICMTTIKR